MGRAMRATIAQLCYSTTLTRDSARTTRSSEGAYSAGQGRRRSRMPEAWPSFSVRVTAD